MKEQTIPTILIVSQDKKYTLRILEAIAKSTKYFFVIIRPHPGLEQNVFDDVYNQALRSNSLDGKIDYKTDLLTQLNECDLVIGTSSTALFNAIDCGIPTLFYLLDAHKHRDIFLEKIKEYNLATSSDGVSSFLNNFETFEKPTVFIRSRGYLNNVKKLMSSCNVIDLDSLLKQKNLFNLLKILSKKTVKEKNILIKEFLFEEFSKHKPDVLIVWDDLVGFEGIAVSLAKEFKVPSIVIQHGFPAGESFNQSFNLADYLCVWNEEMKRYFSKTRNSLTIFVTGNPKFDLNAASKVVSLAKMFGKKRRDTNE